MSAIKVTITIPDNQVHEIRTLVEAGKVANVSALVKHAVGIALSDSAGWRQMLEQALQRPDVH